MAKLTLLAMVQDILNDTNSDPVNSINDTPEATQVANIIRTTYYELVANRNWANEKRTFTLDNVSDTTKPTHLQLPADVKELLDLRYDQRRDPSDKKQLEKITYLEPEHFLDKTNGRDETESNVQLVTDFGGIQIKVRNDVPPTYWTSFDDEYLVFDAWDNTVSTTMEGSDSQAIGFVEQTFTLSDNFTPSLPLDAFSSLLAEAKAQAYLVLRQEVNPRIENIARRQRTWLARKNFRTKGGVRYPDYGRKTHGKINTKNPLLSKS